MSGAALSRPWSTKPDYAPRRSEMDMREIRAAIKSALEAENRYLSAAEDRLAKG